MKKKKIFCWLLGAALAALLLWLFTPQSIYTILDAPEGSIRWGNIAVREWVFEEGKQDVLTYQVDIGDLEPEVLAELLSILDGKGFRPDIRNLLPWKAGDLSASGQAYTMSINLIWGRKPGHAIHITTLEPETFGISTGRGFDVYHPADRNTREKLYQFVRTYGQEQE